MKKRTIVNIATLLCSILISFLILEQSYRVYLFGKDSFSVKKVNSLRQIGVSGLLSASDHPGVVFELKPNLDTYFKLAKFNTNADGLRDKHYDRLKPANTIRIAVIGDSFTMPSGVNLEDSFHAIIEEELNNLYENVDYQVINFGVGGYCQSQYVSVLRHKAIEYQPDLVIIGFCPENDHEILPEDVIERPYTEKAIENSFFRSFVFKSLVKIFTTFQRDQYANTDSFVSMLYDDQLKNMKLQFSAFGAIAENYGIPILIVYLHYINNREYAEIIGRLASEHSLLFLNVSTAFEGEEINKFRIYPTDRHPNKKAHDVFSQQILEYLMDSDLLEVWD
jgi:hypothetical protein